MKRVGRTVVFSVILSGSASHDLQHTNGWIRCLIPPIFLPLREPRFGGVWNRLGRGPLDSFVINGAPSLYHSISGTDVWGIIPDLDSHFRFNRPRQRGMFKMTVGSLITFNQFHALQEAAYELIRTGLKWEYKNP